MIYTEATTVQLGLVKEEYSMIILDMFSNFSIKIYVVGIH